jgi:hypothetical protein
MKRKEQLPIIGWREWVSLHYSDIKSIKAKIDTGVRSSSIHDFDINPSLKEGNKRFILRCIRTKKTARKLSRHAPGWQSIEDQINTRRAVNSIRAEK